MSTLTPEDITRLLELEERATPGAQEARYVPSGMPTDCCQFGIISLATGRETARVWSRDDVEFYAAARNSLRPLCERVRDLEGENERLRAALDAATATVEAEIEHLVEDSKRALAAWGANRDDPGGWKRDYTCACGALNEAIYINRMLAQIKKAALAPAGKGSDQ